MLYRIVVNVIDMPFKVFSVANQMLPISAKPILAEFIGLYSQFATCPRVSLHYFLATKTRHMGGYKFETISLEHSPL